MATQNYTPPFLPTIIWACPHQCRAAVTYNFNINRYTSGSKGLQNKAVIINVFCGMIAPVCVTFKTHVSACTNKLSPYTNPLHTNSSHIIISQSQLKTKHATEDIP
jgi:hypothetical protein